jgi:DNA polymerase-3 subunit delta
MKIDSRQLGGFLRNPGSCRAALLYGDDEGLIRERAEALVRVVAGSLDDPFRVAELGREAWGQLGDEMSALSMIGGRRVIRLRDVTDVATEPVRAALKGPGEALAVLEAPGLGRGKLRTLVEGAKDAAAITCYAESGRAAFELLRSMFDAEGVRADAEALEWLAETGASDRAVLRGEVEKLVLLAGPGGRVDIDMARVCVGDCAGASGDEALVAATSGDVQAADGLVERAMAEGLAGVGLLRMSIVHLQKLHQARLLVDSGMSAAEAVRALRPPVFFRAQQAMVASVKLWHSDMVLRALEEARAVELACKSTGSRADALASRFVSALARVALSRSANS